MRTGRNFQKIKNNKDSMHKFSFRNINLHEGRRMLDVEVLIIVMVSFITYLYLIEIAYRAIWILQLRELIS